jgi:hypothetical protein
VCMYLVAKTLGSNDCDFIAETLVGLEIESETRVISFDNDLGRLFDGLCSNATHVCCVG